MGTENLLAVKSADRVFDLFELLAPRREGLSHTAIADALGIPKSSLTQLLKTAIRRGYVGYDPDTKHYRLGARFGAIAGPASLIRDLIAQADTVLQEITAVTRESSALNILRDDAAEVVAAVNSPQRLVSHMRLGDLAPLYATSGGKVILAHMREHELKAYLGRVTLRPSTPRTITSVRELRSQLKDIRQEGIARSLEEYTPGIIGVATVVLSRQQTPLASINVAIPAVRYTKDLETVAISALRKAASKLEARAQL
ncbi:IclR family transcriptional regulator [Inquilinus sp. Marseille-Q2685]|uniref:IclR family transcriptional regulator n=1 Tax=Inquilinus sp. Marseille-Q2685 TaxID=2866581 RepID=UPI001CE47F69|nr:IclR family transcriptional regulator [Inquilinus sp. Marseille-Q2685]